MLSRRAILRGGIGGFFAAILAALKIKSTQAKDRLQLFVHRPPSIIYPVKETGYKWYDKDGTMFAIEPMTKTRDYNEYLFKVYPYIKKWGHDLKGYDYYPLYMRIAFKDTLDKTFKQDELETYRNIFVKHYYDAVDQETLKRGPFAISTHAEPPQDLWHSEAVVAINHPHWGIVPERLKQYE